MAGDRSRERRRLTSEFLAFARLTSDWLARTYFLDMAQKWIDLAELSELTRPSHFGFRLLSAADRCTTIRSKFATSSRLTSSRAGCRAGPSACHRDTEQSVTIDRLII